METRVQIVAIAATAGLFVILLELVRRRRMLERYAILWLFCSVALLGLSVWKGLLTDLAHTVGIYYAPSALFVIAFGFVLVLLLHFSVAVSRLAEQNKVLAQRVALLEERQRAEAAPPAPAAEPARRFADPEERRSTETVPR
ncbi:MAG: DUF2304 domain-containing protein [Thermoleophilaceae bacterium]